MRGEIRCDERLLAILASTDVQEVVRARVELVADPDRPHVELVSTKRRTTREDGDVAAIGVDVQVVGVQVTDAGSSSGARFPVRANGAALGQDPAELEHRGVGGEDDELGAGLDQAEATIERAPRATE